MLERGEEEILASKERGVRVPSIVQDVAATGVGGAASIVEVVMGFDWADVNNVSTCWRMENTSPSWMTPIIRKYSALSIFRCFPVILFFTNMSAYAFASSLQCTAHHWWTPCSLYYNWISDRSLSVAAGRNISINYDTQQWSLLTQHECTGCGSIEYEDITINIAAQTYKSLLGLTVVMIFNEWKKSKKGVKKLFLNNIIIIILKKLSLQCNHTCRRFDVVWYL